MEVLSIGRWKLKYDVEATREAFSGVPLGSPESCGCAERLNFAAVRHRAYPPEALAIFDRLGIDYRKESEIWHTHRDESGLHHYGGFFHFVGSIQGGEDAKRMVNEVGTFELESVGESFEFGFTSDAALIPESFAGKGVAQLEFQTKVGWVLNEKEPD